MTRLHYVKKARKTKRGTCVKKGLGYFWWQFARCPKQYSLVRPKRSAYQTRSDYLRTLMDLEDGCKLHLLVGDWPEWDSSCVDAFRESIAEVVGSVRELGASQKEKYEAMEIAFPTGCPTMEQLDDRVGQCERMVDSLREAASKVSDSSTEDDVREALSSVSWEYS